MCGLQRRFLVVGTFRRTWPCLTTQSFRCLPICRTASSREFPATKARSKSRRHGIPSDSRSATGGAVFPLASHATDCPVAYHIGVPSLALIRNGDYVLGQLQAFANRNRAANDITNMPMRDDFRHFSPTRSDMPSRNITVPVSDWSPEAIARTREPETPRTCPVPFALPPQGIRESRCWWGNRQDSFLCPRP